MVKEFEEACFNGKPGQIIGPIHTQFGYHIIKCEERKAAEQQPYESVKEQVKAKATQAIQQAVNFARDHQMAAFFPPGAVWSLALSVAG